MHLCTRTYFVEDGHLCDVEAAVWIVGVILKGDQNLAEAEAYDQFGAGRDLNTAESKEAV